MYKPLRQTRGGPSPLRLTVQRDVTGINFNKDFALPLDVIEAGDQRTVEWLESMTAWGGDVVHVQKGHRRAKEMEGVCEWACGLCWRNSLRSEHFSKSLLRTQRILYISRSGEKESRTVTKRCPLCPPSSRKGLLQT